MKTTKEPIHITVTNATSPTAHTFLYQLARGDVFGIEQTLIIHLMDFPEKLDKLHGMALELEAAAMPLVLEISATKKFDDGFRQADFLVLMSPLVDYSGWPDPLEYTYSHAHIFKDQAMALELFAKRTAQAVVVGDLALTNAAVITHFASTFPPERVTCVTKLVDTRVRSTLAAKFRVTTNRVTGVVTWGCAGAGAQYVDTRNASVTLVEGEEPKRIEALLRDDKWLKREFQQICDRRRAPPGIISTAQAVVDHIRDLQFGIPDNQVVGMGVATGGAYGVPSRLFCALPVTVRDHRWTLVPRLSVTGCHQHELRLAAEQLTNELEAVLSLLEKPRSPAIESVGDIPVESSVTQWEDHAVEEEEGSERSMGSLERAETSVASVSVRSRSRSEESFPPVEKESLPSIRSDSVPSTPSVRSLQEPPEDTPPPTERKPSDTSLSSVSIVEGFDFEQVD